MSITKSEVSEALGYKIYTALLTQSNENNPVATVLENTLGDTITWEYISTGYYKGTLTNSSGKFTDLKTAISPIEPVPPTNTTILLPIETIYWDTNSIRIKTYIFAGDPKIKTLTDSLLYISKVEVKVYN